MLDVTITDGGLDSNRASMDECSFGVVGKCLRNCGHKKKISNNFLAFYAKDLRFGLA